LTRGRRRAFAASVFAPIPAADSRKKFSRTRCTRGIMLSLASVLLRASQLICRGRIVLRAPRAISEGRISVAGPRAICSSRISFVAAAGMLQ
jgi:hypothetical protein